MSQHDMDIANQAGAAFRADLNLALQALVGNSSGTSAPTTTFPYMFWADTSAGVLKQRNSANTAWISLGLLGVPNLGHINPGDIVFRAKNAIGPGYLKCNGGAVSRATYSDLFNEIGITFGAGDGSTTFNLPELRGEYIRVWDDSRGVDAGRAFGSSQAQQMPAHRHVNDPGQNGWWGDAPGLGIINIGGSTLQINRSNTTGDVSAGVATGTENRVRNVALLACIKY